MELIEFVARSLCMANGEDPDDMCGGRENWRLRIVDAAAAVEAHAAYQRAARNAGRILDLLKPHA